MGKLDDCLSIVAHELAEVLLPSVSSHCYLWCKDQTEEGIDHWDGRKACAISADEPTTLVVVILAGIGYMGEHPLFKFIGEGINRISVKLNVTLLVDGLKSELIEIAWASKLFIFQLISYLIVAEDRCLVYSLLFGEYSRLELISLVILFILLLPVPGLPCP